MNSLETSARARTRAELAEELGFGFGAGPEGRRARGASWQREQEGPAGTAGSAARGPLTRAEAIGRLREMGFGPIDSLQAFAAVGSTDLEACTSWILSRPLGGFALAARDGGGARGGGAVRSWTPGEVGFGREGGREGGREEREEGTAAEARRLGRMLRRAQFEERESASALRRAGSVPSSALSSSSSSWLGMGGGSVGVGGTEVGWSRRDAVSSGEGGMWRRDEMVVGRAATAAGSGVGAEREGVLPRRSASWRARVQVPGAVEGDGDECCVCMDAPQQTMLVPCAHACLCRQCARAIVERGGLCPLCRSAINGFILVRS